MLKVFIGQPIPNLPITEILRPNLGVAKLDRWTERYVEIKEPVVELAKSPEEADYLLIPHNFNLIRNKAFYLDSFELLAKKHNKKIIIFLPGDSDEGVPLNDCIVFRNSQYKPALRKNEIILPGYVEDIGADLDLKPREKGDKAKIGFCGWADFQTFSERLKFSFKSLSLNLAALANDGAIVKQKGLWWRRKAIKLLSNSRKIDANFIIRRTYSGNEKTIEIEPKQARQEYIDNILQSDFTLCVKGDGNFSTRFFEVLSLGRTPLLLDTDSVLPLEDVIDYSEIVLRVSWKDLERIDSVVADFYSKLSPEKLAAMQLKAREIFAKYLRLDSYFSHVFSIAYLGGSTGVH